ncbi:dTDP-4-dehydrorhamnose 3,5-epimerase [Candidatus Roizmanbacteria bacterium]|nr:dTDP-4-dehydrorhamnose 3,5-epimerase [Candidatus Roizmanbacteria bacterium]
MIFTKTKLSGAYTIDFEKREDNRGFFARSYCEHEFADQGITFRVVQGNTSMSKQKGTMRGMHYQEKPYEEDKLIRCTKGAIYDVIIDLRPDSKTYKQWIGVELSADNYHMLYVPKGCAHGFLTLAPDTEVTYLVSEFYTPSAEHGIRYNDPAFMIQWPDKIQVVSKKDASFPDFKE